MAMIHCRECGVKIAESASSCPKCGAKQKNISSSEKSKTTAAILALFLGGLGIHKFYLGKSAQGILYLLFIWTFIPAIIALIDGIRYLVMSEDNFQEKCVG